MKSFLVCVGFMAFATVSLAGPAPDSNFDEQIKVLSESLSTAAKKIEEVSGFKTNFDKTKFEEALKGPSSQLAAQFQNLSESLHKGGNNVPENLKSQYDAVVKQLESTIKNLNSDDVQKNTKKFQETINDSLKKVSDSFTELGKGFGLNVPPQIQQSFSEATVQLSKSAQNIQESVQKAIEEYQKKSSSSAN